MSVAMVMCHVFMNSNLLDCVNAVTAHTQAERAVIFSLLKLCDILLVNDVL